MTAGWTGPPRGAGLVSTMTLAELRELEYGAWHDSWRPDGAHGDTSLLTLDDLVSLVLDWNRPVKIFIETKHPGPVRLAGGKQVAGPAAPLRHRLAGLRRPVPRGGDVVFGGRRVADPARRAAAAHGAARQDRPLPDQQRGHRRRGNRRRVRRWRRCGTIRNSSIAPSPRAGRCTAGPSTSTTTSTSAGMSGWPGSPPITRVAPRPGCRTRAPTGAAASSTTLPVGAAGTGASEASASNSVRAASWFHTTTDPASLSVNSPIGTVIAVAGPCSAQPSRARSHTWSPWSTVRASAAARGTEYQRHGLSHTAGLAARCSSADMNCRWLTIRSRSARGVARLLT